MNWKLRRLLWFQGKIWRLLAYCSNIYLGVDEITQLEHGQRKAKQTFSYSFYKFTEYLPCPRYCSRCWKYNSEHGTYLLLVEIDSQRKTKNKKQSTIRHQKGTRAMKKDKAG